MNEARDNLERTGKSFPDRSREFALRIIRLHASLPKTPTEQCLGKQLLRSGTSVGAHLSEGKRIRSRAEIISKTEVALQELEESIYWMRLLADSGIVPVSRLDNLMQEASELIAMLVVGINRLKSTSRPL